MDQVGTYGDTDLTQRYDAVVIGSGAGGAPLALRLGERGLRVLVVEQGDFLRLPRGDAAALAHGKKLMCAVIFKFVFQRT